jgi:hypothetical protein
MDFPDGKRRYNRLCNCGTTILGGTFCPTCYDHTPLRDRFRRSRREWQQRRTWDRRGEDDA